MRVTGQPRPRHPALRASNVLNEIEHRRDLIGEPDVDVAIDPEWNVGRHGSPGETEGADAKELNDVSLESLSISATTTSRRSS